MGDRLPPIKTKLWRKFLKSLGLNYMREKGDHEMWSRKDLNRPIIFQTKGKEIPRGIILSNLKTLGMTVAEYKEKINGFNN